MKRPKRGADAKAAPQEIPARHETSRGKGGRGVAVWSGQMGRASACGMKGEVSRVGGEGQCCCGSTFYMGWSTMEPHYFLERVWLLCTQGLGAPMLDLLRKHTDGVPKQTARRQETGQTWVRHVANKLDRPVVHVVPWWLATIARRRQQFSCSSARNSCLRRLWGKCDCSQ